MAVAGAGSTDESAAPDERHASWLELFFDLVAVAGIGMLAHLMQKDALTGGLWVCGIAFVAFWLVWACFTAYGNIAGQQTRMARMLLGMAVLAVMTAAVPEIHGDHAKGFAIAYVVGRVAAARPWRHGTVVVDLPVAQALFGIVPWIISFWFEGTTVYVLWAVGLGLDLVLLIGGISDRGSARRQPTADRRRAGAAPKTSAVYFDAPHLGERLGLFVLIVIGEGLVQAIDAASEATWNRSLGVAGAGAFAFMIALWMVSVRHGYAGVALLPERGVGPRVAWTTHLATTGAMVTVVVALAGLVGDPQVPVRPHIRRLLVGGYAGYGLCVTVVHLAIGLRQRSRSTGPPDLRKVSVVRAATVAVPIGIASALVLLLDRTTAEVVIWLLAGGLLVICGALVARTRP